MGPKRNTRVESIDVRYLPGEDIPLLNRGLRSGDRVTVRIESLSKKGDGVATVSVRLGPQQERRDYRIEVRRALPTEVVEARLEARRRLKFAARIERRLEDSVNRVSPKCVHFGEREMPGKGCGGCAIQSLDYDAQLEFKGALVGRMLSAAGVHGVHVERPIPMRDPFFYRNKMEYSFGDDRDRKFACGLYPQGWHNEVIHLEACHLQSTQSDTIRRSVATWCVDMGLVPYSGRNNTGFLRNLVVREGKGTGECLVELITSGDESVTTATGDANPTDVARAFGLHMKENFGGIVTSLYWTQHVAIPGQRSRLVEHLLWGERGLNEKFVLDSGRSLMFEIQPRSFFQPNTQQGQRLASLVGGLAQSVLTGGRVLDLYCGAGNLALCVAPYADDVLGVEIVADAVEDARRNASANGLENVSFIASDVGAWLETKEAQEWCSNVELVLLDPPRSGLIGSAVDHVSMIGSKAIIYVSCNPEALGRDLARLEEVGYSTSRAQPVDMFPHTAHIETVVLLTKGDGLDA